MDFWDACNGRFDNLRISFAAAGAGSGWLIKLSTKNVDKPVD
jgi:hypothetical protein